MAIAGRVQRDLVEVIGNPSGSEKLTQRCLDQIRKHDSRLRCMVFIDESAALNAARDLDRLLLSGRRPLPLHGLPVVVKEIFCVAGMPGSWGSRIPVPDSLSQEGTFIKRLRAAGCVIIGKSLSTEFAFGQFNLNKAMPINPADQTRERVTGGSSSGSAAAQAAGYCSFAVGTDTGGSVRAPAALCGVAGFKPVTGYWPMDGVFQLSPRFDAPGIFADSVRDASFIHAALTKSTPSLPVNLEDCRIGIPEHLFFSDLEDDVRGAMRDALHKISAAGVLLVPLQFPDLSVIQQYFAKHLAQQLRLQIGEKLLHKHWDELDELTQCRLSGPGAAMSEADAYEDLKRLQFSVAEILEKADVPFWILPTVPCVAPLFSSLQSVSEVAEWQSYVSRNTRYVSALDMAACTIPVARNTAVDLPVGLQIAGFENAKLLAVAAALEKVIGQND